MTTIPLPVLVARLEHELETARLFTDSATRAYAVIDRALVLAKQLREAL